MATIAMTNLVVAITGRPSRSCPLVIEMTTGIVNTTKSIIALVGAGSVLSWFGFAVIPGIVETNGFGITMTKSIFAMIGAGDVQRF